MIAKESSTYVDIYAGEWTNTESLTLRVRVLNSFNIWAIQLVQFLFVRLFNWDSDSQRLTRLGTWWALEFYPA